MRQRTRTPLARAATAVVVAVTLAGCAGGGDDVTAAPGELDAVAGEVTFDEPTPSAGATQEVAGSSDGQVARSRPELTPDDVATALGVHDAFEQLTAVLERDHADEYAGGSLADEVDDPPTIRFTGAPSDAALAVIEAAPIEVVVDTTATHTLVTLRAAADEAAAAIEQATGATVLATVIERTGTIDLDVGDAVAAEVVAALPSVLDDHDVTLHVAGEPVQLDA